jgi:hypothetical protein
MKFCIIFFIRESFSRSFLSFTYHKMNVVAFYSLVQLDYRFSLEKSEEMSISLLNTFSQRLTLNCWRLKDVYRTRYQTASDMNSSQMPQKCESFDMISKCKLIERQEHYERLLNQVCPMEYRNATQPNWLESKSRWPI